MPMSADTTATTITGGEVVNVIPQPTTQNTPLTFDYASTDAARVFPGETLTITCSIGTGTTTGTASVSARWDV